MHQIDDIAHRIISDNINLCDFGNRAAINHELVVASATGECVEPKATVERVKANAAIQRIVPCTAVERVVASITVENVVPGVTGDGVVRRIAVYRIAGRIAEERVRAGRQNRRLDHSIGGIAIGIGADYIVNKINRVAAGDRFYRENAQIECRLPCCRRLDHDCVERGRRTNLVLIVGLEARDQYAAVGREGDSEAALRAIGCECKRIAAARINHDDRINRPDGFATFGSACGRVAIGLVIVGIDCPDAHRNGV